MLLVVKYVCNNCQRAPKWPGFHCLWGFPHQRWFQWLQSKPFNLRRNFPLIAWRPLGQFDFVFSDLLHLKTPYWGRWSFSPRHFTLTILADADQILFQYCPASQITQSLLFWPKYKTGRTYFFHLIWDSTWFILFTFLNFLVVTIFWPHRSNGEGPGCWQVGCGIRAIESKVKNCAMSRVAENETEVEGIYHRLVEPGFSMTWM